MRITLEYIAPFFREFGLVARCARSTEVISVDDKCLEGGSVTELGKIQKLTDVCSFDTSPY